MKRRNNFILLIAVAFAMNACMSVTYVNDTASQNIKPKPDFEDYVPGYFWSFKKSESQVNVAKVCSGGASPLKVRQGQSGEDILLITFTLGIYWPKTVQVWCP